MSKLTPICTVTNCEACKHASLIYEKVYHQLHTPLDTNSEVKEPLHKKFKTTTLVNEALVSRKLETSNDAAPKITCVFTRNEGQLVAHDVQQTISTNHLNPNNPKQGLFANSVRKNRRLEPKVHQTGFGVATASGNFVVTEGRVSEESSDIVVGQAKHDFKFTPYQLQYNKQNDTEKKRRFEELRKHGQAEGYYCFHKMRTQPTQSCCGQCHRVGL
jgi:hypothetical protein